MKKMKENAQRIFSVPKIKLDIGKNVKFASLISCTFDFELSSLMRNRCNILIVDRMHPALMAILDGLNVDYSYMPEISKAEVQKIISDMFQKNICFSYCFLTLLFTVFFFGVSFVSIS